MMSDNNVNAEARIRIRKSATRDDSFARQEFELKRERALERYRHLLPAEQPHAHEALHFVCCSTCGMSLHPVILHDGNIDRCYLCNTVWFDDGGLEQMAKMGPGLLRQIDDRFPAGT
jgi:TFIIB-like protein